MIIVSCESSVQSWYHFSRHLNIYHQLSCILAHLPFCANDMQLCQNESIVVFGERFNSKEYIYGV